MNNYSDDPLGRGPKLPPPPPPPPQRDTSFRVQVVNNGPMFPDAAFEGSRLENAPMQYPQQQYPHQQQQKQQLESSQQQLESQYNQQHSMPPPPHDVSGGGYNNRMSPPRSQQQYSSEDSIPPSPMQLHLQQQSNTQQQYTNSPPPNQYIEDSHQHVPQEVRRLPYHRSQSDSHNQPPTRHPDYYSRSHESHPPPSSYNNNSPPRQYASDRSFIPTTRSEPPLSLQYNTNHHQQQSQHTNQHQRSAESNNRDRERYNEPYNIDTLCCGDEEYRNYVNDTESMIENAFRGRRHTRGEGGGRSRHSYGGEQRSERENKRVQAPPQRYYGRNDDMLRGEYERYKRGSPRRHSGSGGRHSTGGMSSRLEYQSPPTSRHHSSPSYRRDHSSPSPVEPPLSPLSIPTVVGGPTPQYDNNRDIEVISPQNTEAACSGYEQRENHPPSNGYSNDYHHQYQRHPPSSPYHHEVRRQEKYIPSQVSVVRNQEHYVTEKRDDSSTIYTPATLPSTAYTPSPPQSRYQQYRGGGTSTNQEIQSRHSSPHYHSHSHHNNELRVDVVPSSQSHPTQHYTPRGRPPPHNNNSQPIAVATSTITNSSSKRIQLNAEVERKKSQARYQILKEISAATNMRNTSLNDKDVNFWDRQIYTLNESFKKL